MSFTDRLRLAPLLSTCIGHCKTIHYLLREYDLSSRNAIRRLMQAYGGLWCADCVEWTSICGWLQNSGNPYCWAAPPLAEQVPPLLNGHARMFKTVPSLYKNHIAWGTFSFEALVTFILHTITAIWSCTPATWAHTYFPGLWVNKLICSSIIIINHIVAVLILPYCSSTPLMGWVRTHLFDFSFQITCPEIGCNTSAGQHQAIIGQICRHISFHEYLTSCWPLIGQTHSTSICAPTA